MEEMNYFTWDELLYLVIDFFPIILAEKHKRTVLIDILELLIQEETFSTGWGRRDLLSDRKRQRRKQNGLRCGQRSWTAKWWETREKEVRKDSSLREISTVDWCCHDLQRSQLFRTCTPQGDDSNCSRCDAGRYTRTSSVRMFLDWNKQERFTVILFIDWLLLLGRTQQGLPVIRDWSMREFQENETSIGRETKINIFFFPG